MLRFPGRGDARHRLLSSLPRNAVCAEIGVWTGDFSQMILGETQPRELHLIDPWMFVPAFPKRWYGGAKARGQADMDGIHAGVVARFANCTAVSVHRKPSLQAAEFFPDRYFDWIYIDGDHSYEAVVKDLLAWMPKVKRGGIIAGDDYDWRDENGQRPVKRAVVEFAADIGTLKVRGGQFLLQL